MSFLRTGYGALGRPCQEVSWGIDRVFLGQNKGVSTQECAMGAVLVGWTVCHVHGYSRTYQVLHGVLQSTLVRVTA